MSLNFSNQVTGITVRVTMQKVAGSRRKVFASGKSKRPKLRCCDAILTKCGRRVKCACNTYNRRHKLRHHVRYRIMVCGGNDILYGMKVLKYKWIFQRLRIHHVMTSECKQTAYSKLNWNWNHFRVAVLECISTAWAITSPPSDHRFIIIYLRKSKRIFEIYLFSVKFWGFLNMVWFKWRNLSRWNFQISNVQQPLLKN